MKKLVERFERPLIIAGPCSAETEVQLMETALRLQREGKTNILRAGIWKPRTRPNSFEGVGEIGLEWLANAGKETGLLTTTEVANARHAELALAAGIDVLWIGARTTVNPFAVQEIADALSGTNIPILIKNPVNPDVQLWIGAFERLAQVGLNDLTAIHRGFSVYKHAKYRNVPDWEIPIAFREYMPEIPMICDPSHITGNRQLLAEVSQKAFDLNFDGIMIEVHRDPDNAWSDAAQQITPEVLSTLINNLVLRSHLVSVDVASQIDDIRLKVSDLDDRLFEILSVRMQLSEEVGKLKRENNITILQQAHWQALIQHRLANSSDYKLTRRFVRKLMDAIHQESIRHQTAIMNPWRSDEDE
ncbi:MAG: 3-deoxy-7-phosphoheptulonate synthase [Bacteroidetes bacterium RIFCSPHIGHO2_02_FULL_44_7]|nr:MAG: 3-deoxy-7-phosphoheptulonate synthase [Bacteroidetes bacterium RIFCSPHIGHO2_02_FULL_44_7]